MRPLVTGTLGLWTLGLSAGCERLLSIHDPVADDRGDDGGVVGDGGMPASSPLLLSEVVVAPNEGEMIEIVNTSNQEVDLSTYYLSDSGNYYHLPVQAMVDLNDFIVKFPLNARIKGHDTITVAIDTPTNFAMKYGKAPNFSLMDSSLDTTVMNGPPQLTNTGEPIILFQWDGRSDLVRDVDIIIVGVSTGATNALPNKSGMSQDGPDSDTQPSTYKADLNTIKPQSATPGSGLSTKRIALEAGHEAQDGTGNGQSGDDETSEATATTWDTAFTAPTPGDPAPGLLR